MPNLFQRLKLGSAASKPVEDPVDESNEADRQASDQRGRDQAIENEANRQASDQRARDQAIENEAHHQAATEEGRRQASANELRRRSPEAPPRE